MWFSEHDTIYPETNMVLWACEAGVHDDDGKEEMCVCGCVCVSILLLCLSVWAWGLQN